VHLSEWLNELAKLVCTITSGDSKDPNAYHSAPDHNVAQTRAGRDDCSSLPRQDEAPEPKRDHKRDLDKVLDNQLKESFVEHYGKL